MSESQTRSIPSWNQSEQEEIIKALAVIAKTQKAFGKEVSVKDIFEYYKFKLEGRFYAKPILVAIQTYTDTHDDIPTPANIINILTPQPRKITTAEYVAAQRLQEASGYPRFSPEAYLIREYEAQDRDVPQENPTIALELKERLKLS